MKEALEETPTKLTILEEADIQAFIADRQIKSEDLDLITQLSSLPKQIFLENHNSFSLKRERLVKVPTQ